MKSSKHILLYNGKCLFNSDSNGRNNMKATLITTKEKFPIPSNIIKKLDLKHQELIEIQITKLHIDGKLKKEILNILKN